jgi:hypothetical protein
VLQFEIFSFCLTLLISVMDLILTRNKCNKCGECNKCGKCAISVEKITRNYKQFFLNLPCVVWTALCTLFLVVLGVLLIVVLCVLW